ncbi:GAF domain-containing protein [Pleionea sediminis]|uniref:GAF domain-containing protein n=1 Tax=Pleionea sediminis TaxID=2569479 RepID=UPI001184A462|nr:ATP-binding protein [Pleionea sediminis]
MLKLNFSQKIWLGFAVIIALLTLSSGVALYNLLDISEATQEVNETAVPIEKQSNQLQISLLKLGKLSASGYNADTLEQILQVSNQFEQGDKEFKQQYNNLKDTVSSYPDMLEQLTSAIKTYEEYTQSVTVMLTAKKEIIKAESNANEELNKLSNMVDDAGAYLLDIPWIIYENDSEKREMFEGIAGRLDGLVIGLYNVLEDINNSSDIEFLKKGKFNVEDSINGIQVRNRNAEVNLPGLEDKALWKEYLSTLEKLKEQSIGENSIVDFKVNQIEQTLNARQQLELSQKALQSIVATFDALLLKADTLFNSRQQQVMDTVKLSSQSVIIAWIVLILLAWQNFNSMRKSIKKKMADLAKLNSTGEELAATQDQSRALEAVLSTMHEQTGVAYGSVFLMNKDEKLEVKASYPPKQIDSDTKAAQFSLGEGILGKAAENKKIKFVPNTGSESDFVKQEGMPDKALLCIPLVDKDVLIGVMNFSGTVGNVRFEDSDYEFAESIARLLVTTIKNIRMREVIEEQNRTLEQKVKERTAELRRKNKDIATMMANLHQGVFTITEGGVIHNEYSKYLEKILETENIANRNFMDVLFSNTNLGSNALDQISTAVDAMIGVEEMMFDFNSHLLANEVTRTNPSGEKRLLEIEWVPIVNQETDETDKLLVTVRDVTELKELQEAAEQQRKELEIIGQILSVEDEKFNEFLSTSLGFVNNCRELIKSSDSKDHELIARLFRNMHTVKGNARTMGFSYLTDTVHQVEHHYDELRKNDDSQWEPDLLLNELTQAEKDIQRYKDIAKNKLKIRSATGDSQIKNVDELKRLIDEAIKLDFSASTKDVKNWIKDSYDVLAQTQAKPLSEIITTVTESVYSLAEQLGKDKPDIYIDDGNVFIRKENHAMLGNVFMHIMRNAIDHGIERGEERKAKGKPIKGQIDLKVSSREGKVIITIEDDGRGLALNKIYQSAINKGIIDADQPKPSDQEIANLIFSSGFSTASEVTEISGRGVGMDAVKRFVEDSDGTIEVKLTNGQELDDFRGFCTQITLNSDSILPALVF